LHDVDGLVFRDGVGEPVTVERLGVADEEHDVPPQRALLVEDVAADLGVLREVRVERLAQRRAADVLGWTVDMTREMRGELDARHARTILQRQMRVLASAARMSDGGPGKPDKKELNPRLRGAVILVGSAMMVALNVIVSARLHEYYRLLFPLAGFFAPMGVFLIIQGASTEDMRSGAVPRRVIQLMFAAMLGGALLGLYANHVRFGHAF
jgi:hypothetical protein